jgi:hypothetical protein
LALKMLMYDAMGKRTKIFFRIRVILLGLLLSGVFLLYFWNHHHDPRLYLFLNSAPGRTLDDVFDISDEPVKAVEKQAATWTSEEKNMHQKLERSMQAEQSEDLIICRDGTIITGEILSESENAVTILQTYGDSASMQFVVKRSDIARMDARSVAPVGISYRDVRFRMEFPGMNFYRRPPFTVMTTEKFFDVEEAIRNLEYLHEDVLRSFGPLVEQPSRGKSIQIVFFSHEEEFSAYRKKHAPNLGYSAGFYSPNLDRLVLYDQTSSSEMDAAKRQLSGMHSEYKREYASYSGKAAVYKWHQNQQQKLERLGRQETERVLKHEGAHQLFYTYGVHSAHHSENLWLLEGLATYCESMSVGSRLDYAVEELREASRLNNLVGWQKLVKYRSPQGFARLVRNERIGLAYSQSWLLTHWLMQPERRNGFFAYIRFIRNPAHAAEVAKMNHFDRLAKYVGVAPSAIPQSLETYLQTL